MVESRLPKIVADLAVKVDAIGGVAAELIATGARAAAPVDTGQLREAIHVEHEGVGDYTVVAGDNRTYYGHIVEHGSVHTAPRPFLMPAAEVVRVRVPTIAREVLRSL